MGDFCALLESEEAGASICYRVKTPTPSEQDDIRVLAGQPDAHHTRKKLLSYSSKIIRPSITVDGTYSVYNKIGCHSKVVSWGPEELRHDGG